jgi:uncharacterized RDD family membrane protein YckC
MEYTMSPVTLPPPLEPQMVLYAGFWKRALARLIDGVILSIANVPFQILLGIKLSFNAFKMLLHSNGSSTFSDNEMWYIFIDSLLGWLYFSVMESSKFQATFGKIALGIAVTDTDGERISFWLATGRYFTKVLTFLTLGIGYMMAGWTKKKQALHDMIADTLVVRTR